VNWKKEVIVVGFPSSGNTWTARLIGDVLKSRVTGFPGEKPIAEDGPERNGPYIIRQSHLRVEHTGGDGLVGNFNFYFDKYDKNNAPSIVHALRDPRDVIVSYMYYHELPSLSATCDCIITGNNPVSRSWGAYVQEWIDIAPSIARIATVRYTDLRSDTYDVLRSTLDTLGLKYNASAIAPAIKRQSFKRKKAAIDRGEGIYSYNTAIQAHHMRKGVVGDWKNHFNRSCGQRVEEAFGGLMESLGYESNRDWWKGLPE